MKHVLIGLALVSGIAPVADASPPRVVHHQLPPLHGVTADLERYGCKASGSSGEFSCSTDSPIGKLGCSRLWTSPALSGVTPAEPLFSCLVVDLSRSLEPSDYVLASGGMLPAYTRYLAITDHGPILLKSAAAFRERYAPVDSPAEALTFATALTGYTAFGPSAPPKNLRYFLRVLEDTEVVTTAEGYLVRNLLRERVFGCGPHTTSLVDVAVSRDGSVVPTNERKAFEDPKQDDLCVD